MTLEEFPSLEGKYLVDGKAYPYNNELIKIQTKDIEESTIDKQRIRETVYKISGQEGGSLEPIGERILKELGLEK